MTHLVNGNLETRLSTAAAAIRGSIDYLLPSTISDLASLCGSLSPTESIKPAMHTDWAQGGWDVFINSWKAMDPRRYNIGPGSELEAIRTEPSGMGGCGIMLPDCDMKISESSGSGSSEYNNGDGRGGVKGKGHNGKWEVLLSLTQKEHAGLKNDQDFARFFKSA